MYDCAKDIVAFHNDRVTLPQVDRDKMRERRDANEARLKNGLKKAEKPAPREFHSQGSYAMRTMTQHPDKDYDIDDGVYFNKADLVGPRSGDMTALAARQMVRDAVDDNSFKTAPSVRTNCVRVQYDAGYHVDLPVYRVTIDGETTLYELASSDWTRSDARDVTSWFDEQNKKLSANSDNGGQMRRVIRLIKFFARSRPSWVGSIFSGFGITKLVTECFSSNEEREDRSLHDTMKSIRDRLQGNRIVDHPCTPGAKISNGDDDPKVTFLHDRLNDAITWLKPTWEADCTRGKALKCWDDVFYTDYFSGRADKDPKANSGGGVLTAGIFSDYGKAAREAVKKEGTGKYG